MVEIRTQVNMTIYGHQPDLMLNVPASPDAGVAVINTHTCAAMSLLTWTALDIFYYKKPSIQGSM